jgi:serine/threonine protein kinase
LRLIDFGLAKFLSRGVLETNLETGGYMTPNIHTKDYNGMQGNLFAAGVILFLMYADRLPFGKAVSNGPYYKNLVAKQ